MSSGQRPRARPDIISSLMSGKQQKIFTSSPRKATISLSYYADKPAHPSLTLLGSMLMAIAMMLTVLAYS